VRILHVVHQYLPEHVGGAELYTQSLARAQVAAGHRAAIFFPSGIAPADSSSVSERDAVGVHLYPCYVGRRSRSAVFRSTFGQQAIARRFVDVLAAEKPELVHVQHLMGLPAAVVDQVTAVGIPYLITLHDYWFPCANAQLITNYDHTLCAGPDRWINCGRCALARAGRDSRVAAPLLVPMLAYRSRLLRRLLAQAVRVIAPSEFVRQKYAELGAPVGNMVVVPHGIETPPGRLASPAVPHHPGELHIAYVGSLAWQKGVHVLVEAANGLPREGVSLTIFGDLTRYPDYVADLRARAQHPGIRFAGPVSRDALWARLGEADVLAVPSLWHETSSLAAQEAFAAGLPVMASALGALRERVQHERNGLLIPPGDAGAWRRQFERLLADPAVLPRLRAGIQPVRTMAEHLAELARIYEDAITGR